MDPPPPPSREEAPAEKRPLDAAEDHEVAAKKQRLADPSMGQRALTYEVGNDYFWRGCACSFFNEPGVS